jgi:hypothetical protein
MNNPGDKQVTLLDLIGESVGLPERGLIRLVLAVLAFGVTFYVIRRVLG